MKIKHVAGSTRIICKYKLNNIEYICFTQFHGLNTFKPSFRGSVTICVVLKLVVCILLRVLGQVQGFGL
jgi:hypothetical protein